MRQNWINNHIYPDWQVDMIDVVLQKMQKYYVSFNLHTDKQNKW